MFSVSEVVRRVEVETRGGSNPLTVPPGPHFPVKGVRCVVETLDPLHLKITTETLLERSNVPVNEPTLLQPF